MSAIALISTWHPARAAVGSVAGTDYSVSSTDRTYRGVMAGAGGRWSRLGLAAAAIRYDDAVLGPGTAASGVLTGYTSANWGARAIATQWWGDGSYRAWRVAAGGLYEGFDGSSAFLYASRFVEENGIASTGVGVMAEARVARPWSLRGSASLNVDDEGGQAYRALIGFAVRPARGIEFGIEGGASQGFAGPWGAPSGDRDSGGGLAAIGDLPGMAGSDDPTQVEDGEPLEGILQASFRVYFPG